MLWGLCLCVLFNMTVDGVLALCVPCALPYEDAALLKSVWLCGHKKYVYLLL